MTTHTSSALQTSKALPNSCADSSGSEAALQISRRSDWRFLLPDPNLGQVAYLGAPCGTLAESLRLFSESHIVIGMPCENAGTTRQYDVVVASRPSYQPLREAADREYEEDRAHKGRMQLIEITVTGH
jgi:hypothetical protein